MASDVVRADISDEVLEAIRIGRMVVLQKPGGGVTPEADASASRTQCRPLSDADPEATVLSVDDIGAFDLISRAAMLTALRDAAGCDRALPFVPILRSSLEIFLGG